MGDLFADGGTSGYPTSLDTATTQVNATPTLAFATTTAHASKANNLATGLINVETALGTNPSLSYGSQGLVGTNNSGTPTTQYDFSADAVTLIRPSAGTGQTRVVLTNTGTITNDITVAGVTANGRDQAGAFSANSWVYFYWIWNGTTLATISSIVAPPTGPTLPTGYTHWGYLCALRVTTTGPDFFNSYLRGGWVWYQGGQNVLSAGTATTETAVDISAKVPSNASQAALNANIVYRSATADELNYVNIRLAASATAHALYTCHTQVTNINYRWDPNHIIPNVGQNFYYLWQSALGTRSVSIAVTGYSNPNGAS